MGIRKVIPLSLYIHVTYFYKILYIYAYTHSIMNPFQNGFTEEFLRGIYFLKNYMVIIWRQMIKTSQTGLSFKKIFTNSDLRAYCLVISSQKRNEENPSYPFWIYF